MTTYQIGGPSPFPVIKDFRVWLEQGAPLAVKPAPVTDRNHLPAPIAEIYDEIDQLLKAAGF